MNVLVTGGSRGIGRAIALRFARDGADRVAIGYLRNDKAAEETAEELRAAGAEPVLVRGNITSSRVLDEVAALGPLDALVHNAASGVLRDALDTEEKHWDWTLGANARALLALAKVAAPPMPAGSSIVGISSLGSVRVLPGYALVGVSKAALEALVRYLAVELAPSGIRVNAVSGRGGRDGRARALPEPRGDARVRPRQPGRAARRARRHRRQPSRSSARRTPRWSAATCSSSTAASRSTRPSGLSAGPGILAPWELGGLLRPHSSSARSPLRLLRSESTGARTARRRTSPATSRRSG